MRDRALIDRVVEGRPGAFDELYYAYVDAVHRKLVLLVGRGAHVDDLIQDTFLAVHQNIGRFRGDASFRTWLYRIVVNTALQHLRRGRRRSEPVFLGDVLVENLVGENEDGETFAARRESLRVLHTALESLKPKKRIAYLLYEIEGYSLEEIAELTQSNVTTVGSRVRSARHQLKTTLLRFEKRTSEVAR